MSIFNYFSSSSGSASAQLTFGLFYTSGTTFSGSFGVFVSS
jgi:hypothetical protein